MERLEILADEYRQRVEALQLRVERAGFAGMVVFSPVRVSYLSGFFFAKTERPVVLVVPVNGQPAMLIPHLETDHLRTQCPHLETVRTYPEYPSGGSGKHPMLHLADLLAEVGLKGKRLVADHDGYENRWGYRGPKLSQVLGQLIPEALELIDDARMVKSPAEIALVEEACRWGDRAHRILQDKIRVGASELMTSHTASLEATRELLATLGPRYAPKAREGLPANAMFIRGANTANPHGLHEHSGVQAGDVLVTGAYALMGGYESELERTMIVGEPDRRFVEYFEAMLAAQEVAFRAIRPGRTCAEVEHEVSSFIRDELGMVDRMRHHTGHSFGLEGHEHPFLDLGDPTPIEPGMIFSAEPGLYVPGLAGFRHSDTLVVTDTGCRVLSQYPRDLGSLIIGV
jgi:Xaa-Pro aminopeptidase